MKRDNKHKIGQTIRCVYSECKGEMHYSYKLKKFVCKKCGRTY